MKRGLWEYLPSELLVATSEELIHLEHIPVLVLEAPQSGKRSDPWALREPFSSLLRC